MHTKVATLDGVREEAARLQGEMSGLENRLSILKGKLDAFKSAIERERSPCGSAGLLDEANLENLLVRVVDRLRRESIMPGKKYLNEREVAQIIGVKVPTLHAWRGKRSPQGPPWVKLGKMVRYPVADLEAHLGKFIRK